MTKTTIEIKDADNASVECVAAVHDMAGLAGVLVMRAEGMNVALALSNDNERVLSITFEGDKGKEAAELFKSVLKRNSTLENSLTYVSAVDKLGANNIVQMNVSFVTLIDNDIIEQAKWLMATASNQLARSASASAAHALA